MGQFLKADIKKKLLARDRRARGRCRVGVGSAMESEQDVRATPNSNWELYKRP